MEGQPHQSANRVDHHSPGNRAITEGCTASMSDIVGMGARHRDWGNAPTAHRRCELHHLQHPATSSTPGCPGADSSHPERRPPAGRRRTEPRPALAPGAERGSGSPRSRQCCRPYRDRDRRRARRVVSLVACPGPATPATAGCDARSATAIKTDAAPRGGTHTTPHHAAGTCRSHEATPRTGHRLRAWTLRCGASDNAVRAAACARRPRPKRRPPARRCRRRPPVPRGRKLAASSTPISSCSTPAYCLRDGAPWVGRPPL